MELFIQPVVHLEKIAAEVDLPEDPNAWPKEVLDELFKQVPYIADFQPHVVMQRVDGERGYGFGHVEISNQSEAPMGTDPAALQTAGVRSVRLPVIIKNGKLSPFDLLLNDKSKVLPLTEPRLRQAIFRPQSFDVTSQTPGDQSMVGQLYPPYRSNMGFSGGGMVLPADGMGKTSSAFEEMLIEGLEKKDAGFRRPMSKTASFPILNQVRMNGSVLQAILPTIGPEALGQFWGGLEKDAGLRSAFTQNQYAAATPLKLLSEHEPLSAAKIASAIPTYVHPTVVQLVRLDDGYMVKSANHDFWRPNREVIGRGDLVHRFGEKVAFAVDTSGCVTLADHAKAKDLEKRADYAPVSMPGVYKVQDAEGKELVGYVIPGLLDTDGEHLPLSMFTNGSQATIQSEILGEPVSTGVNLPEGPVGGIGFFFSIDNDGQIQATIPLELAGSHGMEGEPSTFVGETYDGRPVEVSVQPNIQEPTPMDEGKLLLPETWRWCSTATAEHVALAGGDEEDPEGELGGEEGMEEEPPMMDEEVKESSVMVRSSGDTFSISGPAVMKLASAEKDFVDFDQALFVLAGLGVDMGHGATKLAHSMAGMAPERVRIGRFITPAEDQVKLSHENAMSKMASFAVVKDLRKNLVKEASLIPDPTAVDTVLSLGFINPENIMTFISYLPAIDDAQMKMCELLLSTRMGLQDLESTALERAIRSTEETIEGLKVIAFQQQ